MDQGSRGFDEAFETFRRDIDPRKLKALVKRVVVLVVLLFIVVFGLAALKPWTEFLWFQNDVRYPAVFRTSYSVRGTLFTASFLISWLFLQFNVSRALKLTLVFVGGPISQGQKLITDAIGFLQTRGAGLVRFGAPVLAFFSALGFSDEFSTYLLATHAQKFGVSDPTYGLDAGFFVFSLPWYQALANFACALLVLTTLITVGVYVGIQGMASIAKVQLGRPAVRQHIHFLIGLTVVAYAVQLFLRTYEVGFIANQQFTGAGVSDMLSVAVQRWLSYAAVLIGVGTLVNGWAGRPFAVPRLGGIGFVVVYAVGVLLVPAVFQRLLVDSNRVQMEMPYAQKALTMTRYGYGLNKVQNRDETPIDYPTPTEVSASKTTLDNMRLWDPTVLQTCLESYQGIRPYYRFFDVDVDRYPLGGKPTLLMLSARQIDLTGLPENSQNWTYQRLIYTHGYGVVVARVDQATTDGEPVLLDQDIPEKSDPQLAITEPRIYFGEQHDQLNRPVDDYAIVNSAQAEFDYPTSNSGVSTQWKGDRGIPIGSLATRLAFSLILGDINIFVSREIRSDSRLLIHRNVLERATRVLPFLKFDSDPYIFLDNGHVFWILDGYTTTDHLPYSSMSEEGPARLNYIRNSVKVVVDAYTGQLTAYSVQDDEPILKAWEAVYPGLVHPSSEIPSAVAAHFRYPEDLLDLQSEKLCSYHVTDPGVFLTSVDLWNIASQRGLQGQKEPIKPFYVEMKLPDSPRAEFVQILPFSSHLRPNLSGWLAAHCDPGVYGQLTLYRLNQATPMPGPEQMEGSFSTTPEIANINKQFQNQNSSIVVGNLLVVPLGNSFMYAESLFLRSNTQDLQSVPRLTKVILALKNRTPVIKDTYREALATLLGEGAGETPAAQPAATPQGLPSIQGLTPVKQVLGTLDQADAALRKGDFAAYGQLERKAREQLKAMTAAKP